MKKSSEQFDRILREADSTEGVNHAGVAFREIHVMHDSRRNRRAAGDTDLDAARSIVIVLEETAKGERPDGYFRVGTQGIVRAEVCNELPCIAPDACGSNPKLTDGGVIENL